MSDVITSTEPITFPWSRVGPFILGSHHAEPYPRSNGRLGPVRPWTAGDRWDMYHGDDVPGFPAHPHRGFETVTIVRRGLVDHADSAGGAARYGHGDVQWLTAGRGLQHGEMFPLLDAEHDNPLEMFQLWLNLPAEDKSAPPHARMLWSEDIPHLRAPGVDVTVIAGGLDGLRPLAPPPRSWAARPDSDVAIWHVELDPGARVTLPAAHRPDSARALFVVHGDGLTVDGTAVDGATRIDLRSDRQLVLAADAGPVRALLLQGRPIAEPIAARGPFVMTTEADLDDAYRDFRATHFGGWPWPTRAVTHGPDPARFARSADGTVERPPTEAAMT